MTRRRATVQLSLIDVNAFFIFGPRADDGARGARHADDSIARRGDGRVEGAIVSGIVEDAFGAGRAATNDGRQSRKRVRRF